MDTSQINPLPSSNPLEAPWHRMLPAPHFIPRPVPIVVKNHKFYLYGGILFSLLIVVMAFTVSLQRTSFVGRASSTSVGQGGVISLSLENSYVFASPMSAAADGTSIIRITVFLLNNQGLGISQEKISIKADRSSVSIAQTQPTTDTTGRAIFDLTSSAPGRYKISAEAQGVALPQTVSIDFQ